MARLMLVGSAGSDDPTRAALPLLNARAAVNAGHDTEVFLVGEAVYLMKTAVADATNPVGWPNVGELIRDVVGKGGTFYIWGGCSTARGVVEADLNGKNARFTNPDEFLEHALAADKVLTT